MKAGKIYENVEGIAIYDEIITCKKGSTLYAVTDLYNRYLNDGHIKALKNDSLEVIGYWFRNDNGIINQFIRCKNKRDNIFILDFHPKDFKAKL